MLHLKYCTFEKTDKGCVTRFPDGTSSTNWPHQNNDYVNLALRCGLQPLPYCQQHDFLHAVLAEYLFDKPSSVLWRAAHNLLPNEVNDWEEKLIYYFQAGQVLDGSVYAVIKKALARLDEDVETQQ